MYIYNTSISTLHLLIVLLYCGVMKFVLKKFRIGRHTLLSRGWRERNKHDLDPNENWDGVDHLFLNHG